MILTGRGRVEVGDSSPREVGPGDIVLIAPGMKQRITNCGADDLVFLAACTPRFVREAYQELEAIK